MTNDGKKLSVTTASNRVNIFKNQNGGSFSLTLDGSRLYGAELHELTDVILSNKVVRDEVNHGTWQFDRWELQKHGKEYEYISYWSFVPDQPTPNSDPI